MKKINFLAIFFVAFVLIKGFCVGDENSGPNPSIKYYLYKRGSLSPMELNYQEMTISDFEPLYPLKILIHGFNSTYNDAPNAELRPALNQLVNVISVDFAPLAEAPNYITAALNVQVVAKDLAQLITNLIKFGIYRNEDIHLIGFSLGAHVAGNTANYLDKVVDKITGLDPAGPGFNTAPETERLDKCDARFVEVIHTDLVMFGTNLDCGHVDYFPNFPSYPQNGCTLDIRCSHFRAPILYGESITSQVEFYAYPCGSRLKFTLNQCAQYSSKPQVPMGYFAPESVNGSYFLKTNAAAPFAKGMSGA